LPRGTPLLTPFGGEAVRGSGEALVVTPFWTACESSPIEGEVKGVARPAMSTSIATMRFSACLLSSIASLLMPFSFHHVEYAGGAEGGGQNGEKKC
jgi:hypothetical protein